MTTASEPSGQRVAGVDDRVAPAIVRGAVSVAPTVSAARTAMPSIAAASYGGRGAQRPDRRRGHAAERVGQLDLHGLQPLGRRPARPRAPPRRDVGQERGAPRNGRLSHRARRRPRCRRRARSPARAPRNQPSAPTIGPSSADEPKRGVATPSPDRDLDDVEPPRGARDVARQRRADDRRRRRRRDPRDRAHERDPDEPEDDERRARVARQPDQRHAAAVGQQRRLARLDREAVADDLAEPRRRRSP